MRFVYLLILFFAFSPLYAIQEAPVMEISFNTDGGGSKLFKKRKHRNKRTVKVNRKAFELPKLNIPSDKLSFKKRTKGGVVLMAILTGPLGGHRLYLGTKPYIPIIYTLTLGGGFGLLPLIDIAVIVFSKDLTKYQNNPQVIMWGDS